MCYMTGLEHHFTTKCCAMQFYVFSEDNDGNTAV